MTPMELLLLMQKCSTTPGIDLACPALTPPPGELPLDPNAPSFWSTTLGILSTCCVLITMGMAVRTFTRTCILKVCLSTLEDMLMIFATICFAPIVGLQLKAYDYGGSKHQWDVSLGDLYIALRYVYAVQILYCLAIYAAKLSILLQIKHIFEGTQQRKAFVFWASRALILLVSCAYIITLMVLIFACTPVRKVWNPVLPGKCRNAAAGYISGTVNLVSDVAVLLLPVVGVARLQMDTRKKAAVSSVFASGLVASTVSATRLYCSHRETRSGDKTYWLAFVGLSGAVEVAMVILCGCFTSFPRFLKWVKVKRIGLHRYGSMRDKEIGCRSDIQSRSRSDKLIKLEEMGVTDKVSVKSAVEDSRSM